jgi:SAM-dependent methyltransferase
MFWWDGEPNFGDALNPILVERLYGRPVSWASAEEAELVGIGSLLQWLHTIEDQRTDELHVWGTGYLYDRDPAVKSPLIRHHAVRGKLSEEFGGLSGVALGDPGLLAGILIERRLPKRYAFGIVPHMWHQDDIVLRQLLANNKHLKLIDVRHPPLKAITEIAQCDFVFSSSLHGLVVADSLGVPNQWLEFEVGIFGSFKFEDYYSAFGLAAPRPMRLEPGSDLDAIAASVAESYARQGIDAVKDRLYQSFPLPGPAHRKFMNHGSGCHVVDVQSQRFAIEQIEKLAANHPGVAEASAVARGSGDAVRKILYILPEQRPDEAESRALHIGDWTEIWEYLYGDLPDVGGFGEDFAGWVSTYTGQPIPLEEMREWRAETVRRLRVLHPRRVLEIGVGTGLLMSQIAPECEEYWATDLSRSAIEKLRAQFHQRPELAARVRLSEQLADDFTGLPEGFFDTVVLNSVIQYFPGTQYLADVARKAFGLLRPGGSLFIGDVRDARSLKSFRTAVVAPGLAPESRNADIRDAVARAIVDDNELLIDPDFFAVLQRQLEDLALADVRVKRARWHNELSRHRYDVVLYKRPVTQPLLDDCPAMRWGSGEITSSTGLAGHLASQRPARVRITGIPNARVVAEVAAARELDSGGELVAILTALAPDGHSTAVDPAALDALGQDLGYTVFLTPPSDGRDGTMDAVFAAGTAEAAIVPYVPCGGTGLPLTSYAKNPVPPSATGLVADLQSRLTAVLPGHLLPHSVVVVSDRRQLP